MRKRDLSFWIRVAVAAVVILLGSGAGSPGIVAAFAPAADHVCTCASGGSHASCPVCNASLRPGRSHASRDHAVSGVPCGDPRAMFVAACEPGTLPEPFAALRVLSEMARPGCEVVASVEQAPPEPATPPPRLARV